MPEFEASIAAWTLIPSDGGRFEVMVNGELVYSKLATGRHAEIAEIRQMLQEALGSDNET
jgi:selenoprotein W-related protein